LVRPFGRIVGMAAALAAVSGLGAGLYGVALGLCFAALSRTLPGAIPCGLSFALAGVAAGAIVGAFSTLLGGDTTEDGVPARDERGEQATAGKVAPKSALRVWSASPKPDEIFPGEGMLRSAAAE
jgi:hypothetical protein